MIEAGCARVLIAPMLAVMCVVLIGGCIKSSQYMADSHQLAAQLESVRGINHADIRWLLALLGAEAGKGLLSVHASPNHHWMEVREHYVQGDLLICKKYTRNGDERTAEVLYAIHDEGAVAIFLTLYRQALNATVYRDEKYSEVVSDPSYQYLITIGDAITLTVNEGGEYDPLTRDLCQWRAALVLGARFDNAEDALGCLNPRAFASYATYVVMAVDFLDDACVIAQAAGAAKEKRNRAVR
jgi:hypothetical protein